jgi:hypothetical protein
VFDPRRPRGPQQAEQQGRHACLQESKESAAGSHAQALRRKGLGQDSRIRNASRSEVTRTVNILNGHVQHEDIHDNGMPAGTP